MATNFNSISKKFFSTYVNGDDYAANTSVFSTNLVGNHGDVFQYQEEVKIATIYNELQAILTYVVLPSAGGFFIRAYGINFLTEGFANGDSVIFEWVDFGDSETVHSVTITIQNITNTGYIDVYFDASALSDIVELDTDFINGVNSDKIVMKRVTKPSYLNYLYGVNPNNGAVSFQSPLDSNQQSYITSDIEAAATVDMSFSAGEEGANLGGATIAFIGTTDSYIHEYLLTHTFKVPPYLEGELVYLENNTKPSYLASNNSLRYDNKYVFGNNNTPNSNFTQTGTVGNYGYFGENFNGQTNFFTIEDFTVTSNTVDVIDVLATNTITFTVVNSMPSTNWTTMVDKAIMGHTLLLTESQYQNKVTPYNDLWMFETLATLADDSAQTGTMITNYTADIDEIDPDRLNVSLTLTYSQAQRNVISNGDNAMLFISVASSDPYDAYFSNRVSLPVFVGAVQRSEDFEGQIDTGSTFEFFYPSDAATQTNAFTNFQGGNGDLWYSKVVLPLVSEYEPKLVSATFRILSRKISTNSEFEMFSFPISIGTSQVSTPSGYSYEYQLLNNESQSYLNLPSAEALNKTKVTLSVPESPLDTTQDLEIEFGFQVTWRDWVQNLAVNPVFFDPVEPNNNQNEKTSNYSIDDDLTDYQIYGAIDVGLTNNQNNQITTYRRYSNYGFIADFNTTDWEGSAVVNYFDASGDPITEVLTSEDCLIEILFTHTSGVIPLGQINGEMWAEVDQQTQSPSFLSNYRDWTSSANLLKPSDELATGNATLVEVVSENNLVKFYCKTNHLNHVNGLTYNYYGRYRNIV